MGLHAKASACTLRICACAQGKAPSLRVCTCLCLYGFACKGLRIAHMCLCARMYIRPAAYAQVLVLRVYDVMRLQSTPVCARVCARLQHCRRHAVRHGWRRRSSTRGAHSGRLTATSRRWCSCLRFEGTPDVCVCMSTIRMYVCMYVYMVQVCMKRTHCAHSDRCSRGAPSCARECIRGMLWLTLVFVCMCARSGGWRCCLSWRHQGGNGRPLRWPLCPCC